MEGKDILTVAASFTGAILSFAGAFRGSKVTRQNAEKTIFIQIVTSERKIWRESVRDNVSLISSVATAAAISPGTSPDWVQLYGAISNIMLRLNPAAQLEQNTGSRHAPDREVFLALNKILGRRANPASPWIMACRELEVATQRLLKKEWEVSKKEAEVGRLATPSEVDVIVKKIADESHV